MEEYRAFSDMYLVASLLSYGYKIARIDKSNPRRQKFFFSMEKDADVFVFDEGNLVKKRLGVGDVEAYFLSRTLLLPGRYIDCLREIRSNIHGYVEEKGSDY